MTAHVEVRGQGYSATASTVCHPCGLDEPHRRWEEAREAAALHNRLQHRRTGNAA